MEFHSSAVQFLEIFTNSVEDPSYRVYLQYELYLVGFDDYLEVSSFLFFAIENSQSMNKCESEEVQARLSAYLNSVIDVSQLQEDSQKKEKLEIECEQYRSRLSSVSTYYFFSFLLSCRQMNVYKKLKLSGLRTKQL